MRSIERLLVQAKAKATNVCLKMHKASVDSDSSVWSMSAAWLAAATVARRQRALRIRSGGTVEASSTHGVDDRTLRSVVDRAALIIGGHREPS